jgi:hypothetical protein
MSLTFREFVDKYKPPRKTFSEFIPTRCINTYLYGKRQNGKIIKVYMSLARAIQVSEISIVWLIKNNHDPKDKIDIASLIHPKNRESLARLSHF